MSDTNVHKKPLLCADNYSKITSWITILIIIITISLLIMIFYPYHKYQKYTAFLDNNLLTIYYKAIEEPFGKDQLIIEGTKYDYKVVDIIKEPVEIDYVKYYPITIEVYNYTSLNNTVLNISFKGKTTTLLKELKRKVSDIY